MAAAAAWYQEQLKQSPEAIERLNEGLSSHYAHLRNAAKQRLRDMGGKAVPVLIGNLPAARVGDMATCVGPPDTIASGCFTVLIGG